MERILDSSVRKETMDMAWVQHGVMNDPITVSTLKSVEPMHVHLTIPLLSIQEQHVCLSLDLELIPCPVQGVVERGK